MRSKSLALVAACCVLAGTQMALASDGGNPTSTPTPSCTPIKQAYAESHWRESKPARGLELCPVENAAGKRNTVEHFYLWRQFRLTAPYPGFKEGDKWLEWLPVPSYIVACETRGYYGRGRWLARNDSGAQGPAQLLGWPAPNPARTAQEKVRYWEVTRQVWESSGPSAWTCA